LAGWRRARENLLEPLAAWRRAREAGGRIKPGAQAPGKPPKKRAQPVERATAQMRRRAVARFTGSTPYFYYDPGACAPGFMPSPASRALSSFIPASRLSALSSFPASRALRKFPSTAHSGRSGGGATATKSSTNR
jgi:hypothetical protein